MGTSIFSSLLNKALFYYYFSRNRYAEALAKLNSESFSSYRAVWAYYQLGLYEKVANAEHEAKHWKSLFAKTVCLAACGRTIEAIKSLRIFIDNKSFEDKRVLLAEALVPFNAELALQALHNINDHSLLKAALQLKFGHVENAIKLLENLELENSATMPELYLYKSNAYKLPLLQQLANINHFLAAFSLAPLSLVNENISPSVTNIKISSQQPKFDGPLVSILMTTYQSATFVASAIASLLAQTYQNIEIIVVDDASDDNTIEVVKAIAQKDARVKCFALPDNAGTYVAKSIALKHAKGEFITCHDSDDWSHPLRIQRQIEPLLKNKHLVATTSHWVRLQDDGVFYARGVYPLMRLNPASPLFRRDIVLKQAGAWDLVRTGADSEFIARLKLVFGRKAIKRIAEPLAFGAHRQGSLMTATETGYNAEGASQDRLDYWNAWGHWHIQALRNGSKPKLNTGLPGARKFVAPAAILVSPELLSSLDLTVNF